MLEYVKILVANLKSREKEVRNESTVIVSRPWIRPVIMLPKGMKINALCIRKGRRVTHFPADETTAYNGSKGNGGVLVFTYHARDVYWGMEL